MDQGNAMTSTSVAGKGREDIAETQSGMMSTSVGVAMLLATEGKK